MSADDASEIGQVDDPVTVLAKALDPASRWVCPPCRRGEHAETYHLPARPDVTVCHCETCHLTDDELRDIAHPEWGACLHDPNHGTQPKDCHRCQALREMARRHMTWEAT